jgi:3',5'-cyclic AMP phosphodiesterase CpdA
LWSKRLLGYANLELLRGTRMSQAPALEMLRRAGAEPADFFVVSGDLSNLALPCELERSARLLREAGFAPERTMVLPGNHDRYVPEALRDRFFERALADWLPVGFAASGQYPIARVVGPLLILGLDTAIPRRTIRSAGHLGAAQLDRLRALLDAPEHAGLWPVIALHHPPLPVSGSPVRQYFRGLMGFGRLLQLLEGRSATLLHGHLHLQQRRRLEGGRLEVVGVPSISVPGHSPANAMGYHVYTFRGDGLEKVVAVRVLTTEQGPSLVRDELQARKDFRP